ncbi:MAG: insulinase family protein [Bacteroidota bacterium]
MFEKIQDKNTLKIKSPGLQNRKTAKIILKNGLKAYLISDPSADKSAASISMQVGSWQDPIQYPGMAHFCEHLLFMGTKTYPKENQFETDVKDHGGVYNAYTASDKTVYMFTVNHNAFDNILNQFAHFFIDPLFNRSSIGRELHAIDQESAMYAQNDYWRAHMVFKQMGNPTHPNALFDVGNSKTLAGIPVDEVKNWYEKYYSAHKGNLVLYAPLTIQELTKLAVKSFSKMYTQPKSPISPYLSQLASPSQKAHITYIKPIKDIRKLSLIWELTPTYSPINNKIPALLAYVLNQKNTNSLYHQLKTQNIAENMHVSIERIGKVPIFQIDINFIKNQKKLPIKQAIEICFQSLQALKTTGIPEYIFEEMQAKSSIKYSYQARENTFSFIMKTASELVDETLHTYPLETVLTTQPYQKQDAQHLLDLLKPSTCTFEVMSPEQVTDVVYDKKEKWYNTEYTVKPIDEAQIKYLETIAKHPEVGLPEKNPFMPVNFDIKQKAKPLKNIPTPLLLEDSPKGKAFFYADDRYSTPKISWHFAINSPFTKADAHSKVLLDLYLTALQEAFLPIQQEANQMGLQSFLYVKELKLNFCIQGYNDKADVLLKDLLIAMISCMPSKKQFETQRNKLAQLYENHAKSRPIQQAWHLCDELTTNCNPAHKTCLAIVQKTTHTQFGNFIKDFFIGLYIEALLAGNLTKEEASQYWEDMKKRLSTRTTQHKAFTYFTPKTLMLPQAQGPYKVLKNIPIEGHATCLTIQAGEANFEKHAAMKILNQALQDAYFSTLRTKQQIAYAIYTNAYEKRGQLLHTFAIQSSTHTPEELLARTEAFLEDYVKDFEAHLPQARFEKISTELIVSLQTLPPNIKEMATKLYQLAFEYGGDFERINKQIDALHTLTYSQLKSYAHALVSRKNHKRLACLIHGKVPKEKAFTYHTIAQEQLKKISNYTTHPY